MFVLQDSVRVVGIVVTKGKELGCKSANKVAKFVRFCDAFSLPVVTFVNCLFELNQVGNKGVSRLC